MLQLHITVGRQKLSKGSDLNLPLPIHGMKNSTTSLNWKLTFHTVGTASLQVIAYLNTQYHFLTEYHKLLIEKDTDKKSSEAELTANLAKILAPAPSPKQTTSLILKNS